jgi:hypothetical protein
MKILRKADMLEKEQVIRQGNVKIEFFTVRQYIDKDIAVVFMSLKLEFDKITGRVLENLLVTLPYFITTRILFKFVLLFNCFISSESTKDNGVN